MTPEIMRGVRSIGRLGFVARFAIASAVAMVLLWAALSWVEFNRVRTRALSEAASAAQILAQVTLQPHLSPDNMHLGVGPDQMRSMDEAFGAGLSSGGIARVKVWTRDGEIVYSDDHDLIGRSFPIEHDLEEALDGAIEAEISDLADAENERERSFGRLLEVYVPLRFETGKPVGAFELYVPYEPIARQIAEDSIRISLVLIGGLVVLWAALFRIVLGASRGIRRDREEIARKAEENQYLALHDQLTDLPNRLLFKDRLEQAIRTSNREGTKVAALILDLDRFKDVNDTLGHERGDELLEQVGPRLREVIRGVDTVARLGGDEFGVLLGGLHQVAEVSGVARKISDTLDRPFRLPDMEVQLGASIGIAIYPDHGSDADGLMRLAEVAMYVAKAAATSFEVYQEEHDHHSKDRLALVGELRHAIDAGQLFLDYQPQIDLTGGGTVAVEGLVRWAHPERGLIVPDVFIPLAEQTGMIRRLTSYVLDQALAQCKAWREAGIELSVGVNLSVRDLLDLGLPDEVRALLERYGIRPDCLELEITESSVMDQPDRALEVLDRLANIGVGLSIDDFGTGYSSLAYLQRLPVRRLKIDRSFVMRLRTSENDAEIVRSTIELGHNLGLMVVAEGVEDAESLAFLSATGCDLAQGFHIARPMPADAVGEWIGSVGPGLAAPAPLG
jgi:diguanylate cyclase (GGDEF)-like protein